MQLFAVLGHIFKDLTDAVYLSVNLYNKLCIFYLVFRLPFTLDNISGMLQLVPKTEWLVST